MPNDFALTGERPYEHGRLMRAGEYITKGLIERVGNGEFRITSRKGDRYVNLNIDQPCDCEDCFFRGFRIRNMCKHTMASLMLNGDTKLLIAWGIRLARREARNEELARTRRTPGCQRER